jgi:hypothetical protein
MAAVLILAACGSADDGDGSPVDAPSDPSGTTSPPDGDLRAPTPIEVVSGGTGGTAANADAEAVAADDMSTGDMRMPEWVTDYVVGDGMPALPTNDTGYVFAASAPVTAEQVAAIAAALGLAGQPERIDEGYGVSWRVGPDDGSEPTLWVSDDAQQNWNYSAAWGDVAVAESCAVSVDADGNESGDCPQPTPPTGVPSADEAEQLAGELLSALGVDPSGLHIETFADEWFVSIDASDRTDDRAATRSWYFGFGAEGAMQYASGTLATPQPVGPYPLVDLDTAVARLTDGFYGGFGGGMEIADSARAVAEPTAEPAVIDPGDEPVSDEPVLIDPMPVDPTLPSEPVVVTLVDVQPDLWWAWDADGTVWLLPAYRFIDSEGGWHVAPAVTDEFLIQADPVVTGEPIPVEPDGGSGGAEPVSPPDSPPVEGENSGESPGDSAGEPDIEPGTDPEVAMALLDEFVGLSIEEFTAEAKAAGFETRVVMQDGESLAVTMDFRTDRVNVVVEGALVVAVDSIG